ncbi:hypothetical protein EAI_08517, partial [Harpegnathos saltator]
GDLLVRVKNQGPGGEKAKRLAAPLKEALPGVVVNRPTLKGEVRLGGVNEAASPKEVKMTLAGSLRCRPEDITLGLLRWGARGKGTVWARLPLAAAVVAARVGGFTLGWSVVSVVLLAARPSQCFRCWGLRHTRAGCTAAIDRSSFCFRCGRSGHTARTCLARPECAVCRERGGGTG